MGETDPAQPSQEPLKGATRQELVELLAQLFPTVEDLKQLVAYTLNTGIDQISSPGSVPNRVFELVQWCEARNRLPDLLAGALRQRPKSIPLQQLAASLGVRSADLMGGASPAALSTPESGAAVRRVLFDESHGQQYWTYAPPPLLSRGYRRVAELTGECGYEAAPLKPGEALNQATLSGYAACVLACAPGRRCRLQEQELEALHDYVYGGGGVLILGAYGGDGHHESNLEEFTKQYGIWLNTDVIMPLDATLIEARTQYDDGQSGWKYPISAYPTSAGDDPAKAELLDGISKIRIAGSCSLRVTPNATVLLRSDNNSSIFTVNTLGGGAPAAQPERLGPGPADLVAAAKTHKVVVAGGWKLLLDPFLNDAAYDNAQLYLNILRWLTAQH
jgi:hypothetical protein